MKILLVNYRYFISGGPERYMFNVKQLLEEHGHEVIPFSIRSPRNVESEYSRYFVDPIGKEDAVYFDEVKKTPRTIMQLLARSIYSPTVRRAIEKEIADVKPDIVYIIHFVNKLSPSVITGAKRMGVPVILRLSDFFLICPRFDFLHNRQICEECLKNGYRECIKRRCVKGSIGASVVRALAMSIHSHIKIYEKIDAFVSPSEFLRSKMIAGGYPADKITCIPTFANDKNNCETSVDAKDSGYGLYFGRITEEKGVETVVRAYMNIPDQHLRIVGDDGTEEANRLKSLLRENGSENICFVGFKSGSELEEEIRGAKVVIIPSIWYDNLPNTALEAFAHSKPVIASDIGSLPELVYNGINGYLFEPGNYLQLADIVSNLDNEDLQELGRNSYRMLADRFGRERHYDKLINLFKKCIDSRND